MQESSSVLYYTCALTVTSKIQIPVIQLTNTMTTRVAAPAISPPWPNENDIPRNPVPTCTLTSQKNPTTMLTVLGRTSSPLLSYLQGQQRCSNPLTNAAISLIRSGDACSLARKSRVLAPFERAFECLLTSLQ